MEFVSTRSRGVRAGVSETIRQGLAPDGGLYVPEELPALGPEAFEECRTRAAVAERLLRPFFDGDELGDELSEICEQTYGFPVPLRRLDDATDVLELFHGPTAAFKDVGAAFLAAALERMDAADRGRLTVLVATSGDTGAAVAGAFEGADGIEVVVLYPRGRVSERQEELLTCWRDNVSTFAVRGDFDDCQRIVKEAFQDDWWQRNRRLSSANSINVGRLLPQATYYAAASLEVWREAGEAVDVVVPTGNAGNAVGCLYAREMGLPIDRVVLATNENRAITHFLETGEWETFPTEQTLATAMDVGNPSNFERIRDLWGEPETIRRHLSAETVTDAEIRETIRRAAAERGEIWDPHTACAVHVREQLDSDRAIVVATAHPAKFPEVVEPLVERAVETPAGMARLLERETEIREIDASLEALREAVQSQ